MKQNISIRRIPILLMFASLLCGGCHQKQSPEHPSPQIQQDSVSLILRVSQCARLHTAEYTFHKIITHNDLLRFKAKFFNQDIQFDIPAGERKIAIPIDVHLKAYIDFTSFYGNQVKKEGDRIRIILPDPQIVVSSVRIDRKQIARMVDLTRSHYTEKEIREFTRQGVRDILSKAPDSGILETARENAAQILIPILCEAGYKEDHITVEYRKEFTRQDLPALLEKNQKYQIK